MMESDDEGGVDKEAVEDLRGCICRERVPEEKNLAKWSIFEDEDAVVETDDVKGSGCDCGEGVWGREEETGSGDCALVKLCG